jgi:predicted esterase
MHGTVTSETRYVWICLHGYGSLGKYFIKNFEFLNPARNLVIVPEGLNKFYTDEMHQRTAAHWMTREDRLDEIADYILFLESLRCKLSWDKNPDIKVIYLGFSQGVTTLIRWLATIKPRADYLLLWGGTLPDDILFDSSKEYFKKINAHFFLGDQDQWLKQENIPTYKSMLQDSGMNAEFHLFNGDHRIPEEVLQNFANNMFT